MGLGLKHPPSVQAKVGLKQSKNFFIFEAAKKKFEPAVKNSVRSLTR